jgi:hypothetical protein
MGLETLNKNVKLRGNHDFVVVRTVNINKLLTFRTESSF